MEGWAGRTECHCWGVFKKVVGRTEYHWGGGGGGGGQGNRTTRIKG